jgi:hypothetical protein
MCMWLDQQDRSNPDGQPAEHCVQQEWEASCFGGRSRQTMQGSAIHVHRPQAATPSCSCSLQGTHIAAEATKVGTLHGSSKKARGGGCLLSAAAQHHATRLYTRSS